MSDDNEHENLSKKKSVSHNFDSFGLDARLLKSVIDQQFAAPTLVQSRVIPVALQGRNVIARSRTGSGKTAAYVLPILQSILRRKIVESGRAKYIRALLLVPTRELAEQVSKLAKSLAQNCAQDITVRNIAVREDEKVQRAQLEALPDIVVSTPGKAAFCLGNSILSLDQLEYLVVDEADLILSYDYGDDLQAISTAIPSAVQTFLMSATLRKDVQTLKKQFCHDPVIIELDEEEKSAKITQYIIRCAEDEKFVLAYAIFKLKLVRGKCIVFVEGIDRCYRLKLFLEQFGIRSCILNSELPVNSRLHVVDEFNKGLYDVIIASDENEVISDESSRPKKRRKRKLEAIDGGSEEVYQNSRKENSKSAPNGNDDFASGNERDDFNDNVDDDDISFPKRKKLSRKIKRDRNYGVSRGIDFKNVACVLNFDLPLTSDSYTHRIGRTARMGKAGMALSFVIPKDLYRKSKATSIPHCAHDEEVLVSITASQEKLGHKIEPYSIDMDKLAGFRYRISDAMKAVTQMAVRQARTRELRQELLKSEKLQRHFEENPSALQQLRHDDELRVTRVQHHLRHVPDYLLPNGPNKAKGQDLGFVAMYDKPKDKRLRNVKGKKKGFNGPKKKPAMRRSDPLKMFTAAVRK